VNPDKKTIFIKLNLSNDDEKLIDESNVKIEFLIDNFNKQIPAFQGKNLISRYDIAKEAKSILEMIDKKSESNKSKFAILISFANPEILVNSQKFSDRKINKISFEFSSDLYQYYKQYLKNTGIEFEEVEINELDDIKSFLENLFSQNSFSYDLIFCNPTRKSLSNILQFIPEKEVEIYLNPVLKNIDSFKIVQDFCVQSLRRKIININTAKKFSKEWTKNFLKNSIKYIFNKGVGSFINLLESKYPVIIIGAGSSIDDNLLTIKRLSNFALIICVDTALIPLLKANIRVDIVVSSDSQSVNALYITQSELVKKNLSKYPLLVCMPTVHPKLIEKYKGKVLFSSLPFDLVKEIDSFTINRLEVGSGGTVSALAFEVAIIMNPSSIILFGTDFCYSNGKLHCNNALFDSIYYGKSNYIYNYQTFITMAMMRANSFLVINEFGLKIRTDPKFLMFLEWFKSQINKDSKNKIYYASKKSYGLSFLKYIETEEIESFISNQRNFNFFKFLNKIENDETDEKIIKKIKKNFSDFINRIIIEALSAKSMIENVLKRVENISFSDSILMYLNTLERNLLNFSSLKTLLTMSFQEYLLSVQYENKEIDTLSFYKNLSKKIDEIILLLRNLTNKNSI
jgi:hypothetical protein